MKKSIPHICLLAVIIVSCFIFISCGKPDKNHEMYPEFNSLVEQACQVPLEDMVFVDLPMGFHFSMTKEEAVAHAEELSGEEKILGFSATLESPGGKIESDEIVANYAFNISGVSVNNVQSFLQSLKNTMDSTWSFFDFEFFDEEKKDKKIYEYCWVRDNNLITLYWNEKSAALGGKWACAKLNYTNIPLSIQWLDKHYAGEKHGANMFYPYEVRVLDPKQKAAADASAKANKAKKATNNSSKVVNSPWDGSVYQVKKYVKSHLKDPSSYESVKWGEVRMVGNTYEVSHVYRAKNSFGGYVVEGGVFTLNENGQVIKYTPVN